MQKRRSVREDATAKYEPENQLHVEIKDWVERKVAAALEWYRGCDVCPETLANVRRDLDSVLIETCSRYGMERLPFLLRARFEGAELVVSAITREVS